MKKNRGIFASFLFFTGLVQCSFLSTFSYGYEKLDLVPVLYETRDVSYGVDGVLKAKVLRSGFGQSRESILDHYEKSCQRMFPKSRFEKETAESRLDMDLYSPVNEQGKPLDGFHAHALIDPNDSKVPIHPYGLNHLTAETKSRLQDFHIDGAAWIQNLMVVQEVYCRHEISTDFIDALVTLDVELPVRRNQFCQPRSMLEDSSEVVLLVKNDEKIAAKSDQRKKFDLRFDKTKDSHFEKALPTMQPEELLNLKFSSPQGEVSVSTENDGYGIPTVFHIHLKVTETTDGSLKKSLEFNSGTKQKWAGTYRVISNNVIKHTYWDPPFPGTHYVNFSGDIKDLRDTVLTRCFCSESETTGNLDLKLHVDDIAQIQMNFYDLYQDMKSSEFVVPVKINKGKNCLRFHAKDVKKEVSGINFIGSLTTSDEDLLEIE